MNSKDRPPTTSFISNGEKLLTKVAKKLLTNVTKRDRELADAPFFNPEELTAHKRAWAKRFLAGGSSKHKPQWSEHLYEHFAIVGLPPNTNVRAVSTDIKTFQKVNRAGGAGMDLMPDGTRDKRQYGLRGPALVPQVLYTHPSDSLPPDLTDQLAAFCFPHGVRPELLERTPSMSALNEVIYSQPFQTHDDHSFVFLMKVVDPGSPSPRTLYGVCCLMRELVHRPPAIARDAYPSCTAPLSRYMVVAPRCYCLLTHYPFFPLHFRVLQTILGLERLERMTAFASELAGGFPTPPPSSRMHSDTVDSPADDRALSETAASRPAWHSGGASSDATSSDTASTASGAHHPRTSRLGPAHHSPTSLPPASSQRGPPAGPDPSMSPLANGIRRMTLGESPRPGSPPPPPDADTPSASAQLPAGWGGPNPPFLSPSGGVPLGPLAASLAARGGGGPGAPPSPLSSPGSNAWQSLQNTPAGAAPVPPTPFYTALSPALAQYSPAPGTAAALPAAAGTHALPHRNHHRHQQQHYQASYAEQQQQQQRGGSPPQSQQLAAAATSGLSRMASVKRALHASLAQASGESLDGGRASHSTSPSTSPKVVHEAANASPAELPSEPAGLPDMGREGVAGGEARPAAEVGGGDGGLACPAAIVPTPPHHQSLEQQAQQGRQDQERADPCLEALQAQQAQHSSQPAEQQPARLPSQQLGGQPDASGTDVAAESAGEGGGSGTDVAAESAGEGGGSGTDVAAESAGEGGGSGTDVAAESAGEGGGSPETLPAAAGGSPQAPSLPPHRPSSLETTCMEEGDASGFAGEGEGEEGGVGRGVQDALSESGSSMGDSSFRTASSSTTPSSTPSRTRLEPPEPPLQPESSPVAPDGHGQGGEHELQGEGGAEAGCSEGEAAAVVAGRDGEPPLADRSKEGEVWREQEGERQVAKQAQQEDLRQPGEILDEDQVLEASALLHAPASAALSGEPSPGHAAELAPVTLASCAATGAAQQAQQQLQQQPSPPPSSEAPPGGEVVGATTPAKESPATSRVAVQVSTRDYCSPQVSVAALSSASTPARADILSLASYRSQLQPSFTAASGEEEGCQGDAAAPSGGTGSTAHSPAGRRGGRLHQQQVVRVTAANLDLTTRPLQSLDLLSIFFDSVVPQPGQVFEFQPDPGLQSIAFERPDLLEAFRDLGLRPTASSLPDIDAAQNLGGWTVAALCRAMSLDNILTFITAALLERQMVVFCPNLGLLCGVVLSLVPMLLPFCWQSLMLPVLPATSSRLDIMEAPVPFVLGVQYKTSEVRYKCGGLIRVNVYKDKIKNTGPLPQLPSGGELHDALHGTYQELRKIGQQRSAVTRPVYQISDAQQVLAECFLSTLQKYFKSLMADLKAYTITDVSADNDRVSVLLKDSFIDSFPPRDRAFMRQFGETQMFAVYCDAVIDNMTLGNDRK